MAGMGGVSIQQVLRKRHDVIVRHTQSDGFWTEIIRSGVVVGRFSDDCLATNSLFLTERIWRMLYRGSIVYAVAPAYTYLPGKSLVGALGNWDREGFESVLLPVLRQQQELAGVIAVYDENREQGDDGQRYLLYDALVRLYMYARGTNLVVPRVGIDGYVPVDFITGIREDNVSCVDVTGLSADSISALRIRHSGLQEKAVGTKVYLVRDCARNTYEHVQGRPHLDVQQETLAGLVRGEVRTEVPRLPVGLGVIDGHIRNAMIGIVGNILGQSGNPVSDEEREVLHYHKRVTETGKIGKNALVGLGGVCGEGELGVCLDRVYAEVRKRVRGAIGDNECLKLAASKLAGMNSAKILQERDGEIVLVERVPGNGGLVLPLV